MRKLLTIGEVAKLLNLSTSQIRFYEKKGLLEPHYIDTNGYRLYSYEEIDTLEFITTFRMIGVSISEIKDYIDQKNQNQLIDLLDSTTKQLNEKIIELKKQVDKINELKKHYAHHLQTSPQMIHYPTRQLYVIDGDMSIDKEERELYNFVKKYNIDYRNSKQQFISLTINQTQKLCLYTLEDNPHLDNLESYTLEEGDYFSMNTEIKDYSELLSIYDFIANQSTLAGYRPVGPGITIEDTNTLIFSRFNIRLIAQVRIINE